MDSPTTLSPPKKRQCSILMQRSSTTSRPASRARAADSGSEMPSCIQITFAPSAMASSTTGGTSSGRRKMSTISSGPELGGLLQRGHARAPEHLVAGRVDRDDVVAVGRPCGPSRGGSGARAAATGPPRPGGGSARGCGARRPRARRRHSGVLGHAAQYARAPGVHKSFTTGSQQSHPPATGPGLRSPRNPGAGSAATRRHPGEEHHHMARGRRFGTDRGRGDARRRLGSPRAAAAAAAGLGRHVGRRLQAVGRDRRRRLERPVGRAGGLARRLPDGRTAAPRVSLRPGRLRRRAASSSSRAASPSAAATSALADEELTGAQKRCGGVDNLVEIPVYVSPIAVAYNLPSVDALQLSPDTLAKIFERTTSPSGTTRPSPADNPASTLPGTAITTVVRRSDALGHHRELPAVPQRVRAERLDLRPSARQLAGQGRRVGPGHARASSTRSAPATAPSATPTTSQVGDLGIGRRQGRRDLRRKPTAGGRRPRSSTSRRGRRHRARTSSPTT